MHWCLKSTRAPHKRWMILFKLLRVMSNLSDTERITSEFAINHRNANTCLRRGIGVHPKACCCGILPVACTSLNRASMVTRVILKWLLNSSIEYAGKEHDNNLDFWLGYVSWKWQLLRGYLFIASMVTRVILKWLLNSSIEYAGKEHDNNLDFWLGYVSWKWQLLRGYLFHHHLLNWSHFLRLLKILNSRVASTSEPPFWIFAGDILRYDRATEKGLKTNKTSIK